MKKALLTLVGSEIFREVLLHLYRYGYHHPTYQPDTHICTAGVKETWHGPRAGDSGSALNFKENGR